VGPPFPKFWAKVPKCVDSKALFAGHFAFSASEWKNVHTFGLSFGPSARFWAQVFSRKARICGHSGAFRVATCIFCLRVEILYALFGLSFGPKFLAERPDCVATQPLLGALAAFSASEWNFALSFGPSARFWAHSRHFHVMYCHTSSFWAH
jgi:hypothetical protein